MDILFAFTINIDHTFGCPSIMSPLLSSSFYPPFLPYDHAPTLFAGTMATNNVKSACISELLF
jgi:hypothetical protein